MPQTPKQRDRKRCYRVTWRTRDGRWITGGKIVWLTDQEQTLAYLKHPNLILKEILERDLLEEYKKYINQTIE